MRLGLTRLSLLSLSALLVLAAGERSSASTRNNLALVVNGCVLSKQSIGIAFPCVSVDIQDGVKRGFAIVRPPSGKTEVLLVATSDVTGLESPALRQPDAPPYFAEAWEARSDVVKALGFDPGWDGIGLAVNSLPGRTQDRLHIHVDCVQGSVREALRRSGKTITDHWQKLPFLLADEPFWARRISADELESFNPVRSVMESLSIKTRALPYLTIGVIGATFSDGTKGFYVLAGWPKPGSRKPAIAEDLLDHQCSAEPSEASR